LANVVENPAPDPQSLLVNLVRRSS